MTERKGAGSTGWPAWPVWIASCGGVGYLPIPGTFGAALGLGLVAAASRLPLSRSWLAALLGGSAAVLFIVGAWLAGKAERFFACKDPSHVVIDEVVGQIVTFLVGPDAPWKWLLGGFVLFRIFDVIKPFPARRAEHLPGGWGIMTDDLAAGLYSLIALLLLRSVVK